MRDRLIELISKASVEQVVRTSNGEVVRSFRIPMVDMNIVPILADHILEDGWIRPPCKVDDVVYATSDSRIVECVCHEITLHHKWMIATSFKCDYDCEGCPFKSWSQDYCGEYSCQGEYGDWFFSEDDFGKTVFLTREEAEQALEGGVK